MKCADCGEEILQKYPWKCPYCGSANLISSKDVVSNSIVEIEKLEKAGKYEATALRYEKLEMLDKAKECKRMAETSYAISAKIKNGKVSILVWNAPIVGHLNHYLQKTIR